MVAALLSVVGSLAADFLIVKGSTTIYPAIRGFSHFRVFDYGGLTVLGIAAACLFWLLAINVSSSPRRLYLRLAIVTTIVLWIPDGWLLARHEPFPAVGTLMVMHLGVAFITYNALVRIAVARPRQSDVRIDHVPDVAPTRAETEPPEPPRTGRGDRAPAVSRPIWIFLLSASCFEFIIGVGALLSVPYSRPNTWIPVRGEAIYLAHAILGGVLAIVAFGILIPAIRESRIARIGSLVGCSGVAIGAGGGMLAVFHSLRLIGMALMLVGVALAFFGYLAPIIEPTPSKDEPGP